MKPLTYALLLLALTACRKEQATQVDYEVIGNKFRVTWVDNNGNENSAIGRGKWTTTMVFEAGDPIGITACTIPYDTNYNGVDTTLTEVFNAGVSMWAFRHGERRTSLGSAGTPVGGQCDGFRTTVPE